MTQVLKSKRIRIYDEDGKKAKCRVFSPIELACVSEIWARIEDICLQAHQKIKGKYITIGSPKCCSKHSSHKQTSFIIEIDPTISIQSIMDIKEALKGLVEFSTITARYDKGVFLDLVFIQN